MSWAHHRNDRVFLRNEQNVLLEQLRRRSARVANIYFGGLRALTDEENPCRFELAAHAFRELISHCSELAGTPPIYGDGMKQRLVPVKKAYLALKEGSGNSPGVDGGVANPVALREALDDFFAWAENNRPEARKKTALLLAQLAGPGPALPSDVVADDVSGWMDSDEYFKRVAHHDKVPDRDEFIGRLYVIENVLLRRMEPRPVRDLDEIDLLLGEVENGR